VDKHLSGTGNFLAFVAAPASEALARRARGFFGAGAQLPAEVLALPTSIEEVSWSDHWPFEQRGMRALMLTDTAPYRYPEYHKSTDTPDRLDYGRMSQVVVGVEHVIAGLSNQGPVSNDG
jgi:Zn-dependent M28 family amino/carboxypeptidase